MQVRQSGLFRSPLAALQWRRFAGFANSSSEVLMVGSLLPRRRLRQAAAILAIAIVALAAATPAGADVPVYGYVVLGEHPHDPEAFTQGLIFENGFLYEGTGRYGRSSLRKVVLETGEVLLRHDLPEEYFGEGITALRDTLYQLTWRQNVGFSYVESDSFERIETFAYPWEGWGLTHDGTDLIASDGSSILRFLDPRTRELRRELSVHDDGVPVTDLNELEFIQGRVYANIWYSERIAVIDPGTGRVESYIDLSGLRDLLEDPAANVLNGIAYDSGANRLFVTGKWWPKLFEIDVPPLHAAETEGGPIAGAELLSVRPNPSSLQAEVRFSLPAAAEVSVRLFDPTGRPVRRLAGARYRAGEHLLPLRLGGLSPGAYFLLWEAGGRTAARKLVLVR